MMEEKEFDDLNNMIQEDFKNRFDYLMSLSNSELRREIENSNWNFILQELRYAGEEIERLNNIIKQQDTRNSRQRIANRKLLEKNQNLVIENLKSNNIINEFEKWLKVHLEDEFYWFKIYDKLQELKRKR